MNPTALKGRRQATDELHEPVKSVRSREFEYEGRLRRSLDRSSYDGAQAYELADMLYLQSLGLERLPWWLLGFLLPVVLPDFVFRFPSPTQTESRISREMEEKKGAQPYTPTDAPTKRTERVKR